MYEPEQTRYEQVEFDKINLYVQQAITKAGFPGLSENTKYRAFLQVNVDNMVMQLLSWCVAGRVPSNATTEYVEWPDGPWQAFKAKYAPKWFLARFPVKNAHKNIDKVTNHYFVCPHLVTDQRETHVRFMMTARESANRKW